MSSKLGKLAVAALSGGIGSTILRKKDLAKQQNAEADAINVQDYNSIDDPLLQEAQANARLQANAPMAGSGAYRNAIFQNMATTLGTARRNAVSSSQALSVAAGLNGQTNDSLSRLQTAEAQDAARKQAVLTGTLTQQGQMANYDRYRRYITGKADKAALRRSAILNEDSAYNMPLELATTAAGIATGGGFGGLGTRRTTGG